MLIKFNMPPQPSRVGRRGGGFPQNTTNKTIQFLWRRYVRRMSWQIRLSVCRLSAVTFMRPTHRVELFGSVFSPV